MAWIGKGLRRVGAGLIVALAAGSVAFAQSPAPVLDRGDTAWVLTATALVLFMTLPGLALSRIAEGDRFAATHSVVLDWTRPSKNHSIMRSTAGIERCRPNLRSISAKPTPKS